MVDFDNGWVLVRVVNATLGIVCVVWMTFLMNARHEGPGWSSHGRRLMCTSHLVALVVITMAQIRNVSAHQPLNLIAWSVVGLMLLTLLACVWLTHDQIRERRRREAEQRSATDGGESP